MLENACRKRQEIAADKMKRAQEMREKVRDKLLTLENELKELTESALKVCKTEEQTEDCREWEERMNNATKRVNEQIVIFLRYIRIYDVVTAKIKIAHHYFEIKSKSACLMDEQ